MTARHEPSALVPPAGWATGEDSGAGLGTGVGPTYLAGMVLLGVFVRVYGLAAQSLWVDELLTWNMIRPGAGRFFGPQILDSIQGPLFMAVLWPLVRLQATEWMMRLPSLVAGIAALPLFGWLVGRWLERRTARLALLLLVINPFHIWYSQESRGYAFLVFFCIALAAAYDRLTRDGLTTGRMALFAVAGAGAVLSNLSGLFLWCAMAVTLLLWHRPTGGRQWRMWVAGFGAGFLVVLPWLLKAAGIWAVDRIVPGAGTGEALRGETTFSFLGLPYSVFTFLYGYSLGPSLRELHQPDRMAVIRAAAPLLAAAALPVGAGLLTAFWRRPRFSGFLLVWILVPMGILLVLALRNIKPWNPRYVSVVLPWILVLVSIGLGRLPRRSGLWATVLLCGLTLWSLGNYYWSPRYAKADVRQAAALVAGENEAGDPILVPAVTAVFDFYYAGPGAVLNTYGHAVLGDAAAAAQYVAVDLADIDRLWVVLGREWVFDPRGVLTAALARSGRLRLEAEPAGVRVFSWVRDGRTVESNER